MSRLPLGLDGFDEVHASRSARGGGTMMRHFLLSGFEPSSVLLLAFSVIPSAFWTSLELGPSTTKRLSATDASTVGPAVDGSAIARSADQYLPTTQAAEEESEGTVDAAPGRQAPGRPSRAARYYLREFATPRRPAGPRGRSNFSWASLSQRRCRSTPGRLMRQETRLSTIPSKGQSPCLGSPPTE